MKINKSQLKIMVKQLVEESLSNDDIYSQDEKTKDYLEFRSFGDKLRIDVVNESEDIIDNVVNDFTVSKYPTLNKKVNDYTDEDWDLEDEKSDFENEVKDGVNASLKSAQIELERAMEEVLHNYSDAIEKAFIDNLK